MPEQSRKQIVIFGTGKGADTARRYFQSDTLYAVAGYIVDREFQTTETFNERPVVAFDEAVSKFPPADFLAFVPLGAARMNELRQEKYAQLKTLGYRFASFVHSSNNIEGRCEIGENCFVLENQCINFDVSIGNNVVIWSGCQIGDRSRIHDHVYFGSHVVINGDVEVGEACYLGSNCTIGNGVRVGRQSFIGANALINQNTKERAVHVVQATPAAEIDSLRFMRLIRAPL